MQSLPALTEYVQRHCQLRILKSFGTVDFDPNYDYKAERRRSPKPEARSPKPKA